MTSITPQQAATAERLYREGRTLGEQGRTTEERAKYEQVLQAVGINVDTLRLPLEQRLARAGAPAIALTSLPQPVQNAAYNLAQRYHRAAYEALSQPADARPDLDAARRGLEIALGISDSLRSGPNNAVINDPLAHVTFANTLVDMVRLRVRSRQVGAIELLQPGQNTAGAQSIAPNVRPFASEHLVALEFARYALLAANDTNGRATAERRLTPQELHNQIRVVNTHATEVGIDAARLIAEAATNSTEYRNDQLTALRAGALAAMPAADYARAWLQWYVRANGPVLGQTNDPAMQAMNVRYRARFMELRRGIEQRERTGPLG